MAWAISGILPKLIKILTDLNLKSDYLMENDSKENLCISANIYFKIIFSNCVKTV